MGKVTPSSLPGHIAIVMDGNGRWAKKHRLPKPLGHVEGVKAVDRVTEAAREMGIKALTLYSFSSENWKRPKEEVSKLMNLLYDRLEKKLDKLQKNNIRLNAIGRLEGLPGEVNSRLESVMRKTAKNDGMTLTLALNYGSRQEILDGARRLAEKINKGGITPEDITEDSFGELLYTKGLPEVDLFIRTSGEMRISNFLLWQLSYSEMYFTKKLWPDFGKKDLEAAVSDYAARERRYGG